MKTITISREFGSGGRELGKRLADTLAIPCYDHEIIPMVAERHELDNSYIERVTEKDIRMFYATTIAHRLIAPHPSAQERVQIMVSAHEIIKQLAKQGDCVIIGRCADIILREMNPMNLFVYADRASKLRRCRERSNSSEHFSEKDLVRMMKQIDRERAAYRSMFTEKSWGDKKSYHLCINTSGREIKMLIPAVAEYVKLWYSME